MQYYFIENNTQRGPFPKEKLLENGLLSTSLVWREGLDNWTEASNVDDLKDLFINKHKSGKKISKTWAFLIFGIVVAFIIVDWNLSKNVDGNDTESNSSVTPPNQSKKLQLHSSVLKAEKIRSNSAFLKGTLNSKSDDVLSYSFEYKHNGYTQTVPAILNGDEFSAVVTDLVADSYCEFCIVEKQNGGTIKTSYSSFTTLPNPTEIKAKATLHSGRLIANISSYYLKKRNIITACDYRNNVVRSKAASIASQSAGNFNIGQVCDIFDYCYNNWRYVNDPNDRELDLYQKASTTIRNGLTGDCDDFAILMASMFLSIGGDARVNVAYTKSSGHAFTELNMGKTDMKVFANYIRARYNFSGNIWYRKDSEGNGWLNLDWWAKHPGGEYYEGKKGARIYIIDEYLEEFSYK